MEDYKVKYYPTVLQSIHLVILYIFIQTVVDFPLALIDYFRDTEYLYHPVKKIVLGIGSVLFILHYGFKRTGSSIREVFPLRWFNPVILLLLFIFFAGIQQLLNVVNGLVDKLLPPPPWFWELFDKIFENDYGFWGAFMKVVVIAPVIEELIFRGVVMHGLMKNYTKATAVFYSGLLFALFHLNPWQFPATFVLGLLLGWLMIRTRNLVVCIAGHAVNNLLVLLSITFHQEIAGSAIGSLKTGTVLMASSFLALAALVLMGLVTRKRNKSLIQITNS